VGIIQTSKQLRPRQKLDLYPTPVEAVRRYLDIIPFEEIKCNPFNKNDVLDPGAGNGVWGWELSKRLGIMSCTSYGLEYRDIRPDYQFDEWITGVDYLVWEPDQKFDIIVGNPPYGVDASGKKDKKTAEKWIRKSYDLLKDGGFICFLLRLGFLEGQHRYSFWKEYPPRRVWVSSRRPSFTGNRKTDATSYSVYLWQKGYQGKTELDWMMWDYAENS
jgi:predicted RNA methylase